MARPTEEHDYRNWKKRRLILRNVAKKDFETSPGNFVMTGQKQKYFTGTLLANYSDEID